jgi:hypothetical protein
MRISPVRMVLLAAGISLICSPILAKEKLDDAVSVLKTYLDECAAKSGYDPDNTASLGKHELHSGEGDYAQCAYAGINKYLKTRSRIPDVYDHFIATHKELTAKVKSGETTRDERKAALKTMMVSIRNQEEALEMPDNAGRGGAAASSGDATAKSQADTVQQMEDMKRIQDTQRQVNRTVRSLPRF